MKTTVHTSNEGVSSQVSKEESGESELTISLAPQAPQNSNTGDRVQEGSALSADPVFQGKCAAVLAAERIGLTVTRTRAPGSLSSWEHHRVIVTGMEPEGVAQKSDLVRIGDEIVTVDGKAVYSLKLSDIVRQIEKTAVESGSSLLTIGMYRNNSEYVLATLYRPLKKIDFEDTSEAVVSTGELRRSSSDFEFDYNSPNGRHHSGLTQHVLQTGRGQTNGERDRGMPLLCLAQDAKLRRLYVSEVQAELNSTFHEPVLVGDTLLAINGTYVRWNEIDRARSLILSDPAEPSKEREIFLSLLRKSEESVGNSSPRAFSVTGPAKAFVREHPSSLLQEYSQRPERQGKDFWLTDVAETSAATNSSVLLPQTSTTAGERIEEDSWLKMVSDHAGSPPFLTGPASIQVTVQSIKNLPESMGTKRNLSCHLSVGVQTSKTSPKDDVRFSQDASGDAHATFHVPQPSQDMLAVKVLDLDAESASQAVGSVSMLLDSLARWAKAPEAPSRCWFRLRDESGVPITGSLGGPATIELLWKVAADQSPHSTGDEQPPEPKAPPSPEIKPPASPQTGPTVTEHTPNVGPETPTQQPVTAASADAAPDEVDMISKPPVAPGSADEVAAQIAVAVQEAAREAFLVQVQKELALAEERVVALEQSKASDEAKIQNCLRDLQGRQRRVEDLSVELERLQRTAAGDAVGSIVEHARSGALRRELEELLAAASTDDGAADKFRMPSSAFLAQGCSEAMLIAEMHRSVHAHKARTLKAEAALSGAERVISDQAAEIIGLKAQLREITGKTPRRRKSLEGAVPAQDMQARALPTRPAVVRVDAATATDNPSDEEEWDEDSRMELTPEATGRPREQLEADLKAACAQVEEQMLHITRVHLRMAQAGIEFPEDLFSARAVILPNPPSTPRQLKDPATPRVATPRQIGTNAPAAASTRAWDPLQRSEKFPRVSEDPNGRHF